MDRLPELKSGIQFNKMGKWYVEIDKVIKQTGNVALVECHEDDGLKVYNIFLNDGNGWYAHLSTTDIESAEHSYNIWTK